MMQYLHGSFLFGKIMSLRQGVVFASLLASMPAARSADAPLIPIDSFVRQDEYSMPQLSPDGKYLAITMRLPRGDRIAPTIMVYSLPAMTQMSATQLIINHVPVKYTWVSNTRLVISTGVQVGSLEAPKRTGEVLGMDFDGGKQEYLYGWDMDVKSRHGDRYTNNNGWGYLTGIPRVRNGRFYMTTRTTEDDRMLYDVNSMRGERKLLASIKNRYIGFVQQRDGTPRFAVGNDPVKNQDILYRRDDKSDTWNVISGQPAMRGLKPFAFSADDTEFLALLSPDGGPAELVRENLATGKRVSVMKDSIGDINEFVNGVIQDLPIAAGTNIGIPQVRYLDDEAADAKLHKTLSAKFPGHFVDFINYTDDGSRLLFRVRSDREPGAYFLYDRASGKAYPLFSAREQIDPEQMAERRPVSFKARDGLELHGYITLPQRSDGKPPPLVLMPHGGPHGVNDTWFFDDDAQFLASRGYAVLQVNFRGSSGRGQAFEQAGYGQWGAKIQDDLIDGVNYAIAQRLADPGRVCAYGTSFGGYSALMVTVRAPGLFKCAVGYAGVYDLNLYFKDRGGESTLFKNILTDYLGTDKAERSLFSPALHADKVKVPVLLVHGKDDETARFEHAEIMREALKKAGNSPEWMAVPNEGHGFYATKNVTAFYETLEAFLAKHLK
jgi:dipeptidyl aminopeptidase/acylaminoacyl peptidase